MERKNIPRVVERKLWVYSLGICGNPKCQKPLFEKEYDIGEKAHIVPYSVSQNNSFENLIILCPTCHTIVDKSNDQETLKIWKKIQEESVERLRQQKFPNFEALQEYVKPLLIDNKMIYENYYLGDSPELWKEFEPRILTNNFKIQIAIEKNIRLFQGTQHYDGSNYKIAQEFLLHLQEFEFTRTNDDKLRKILFPEEINSIFGIEKIELSIVSNVSALQKLITIFKNKKLFIKLELSSKNPYIEYYENNQNKKLFLNDRPRVKQLYWDNYCYSNKNKTSELRLQDVCYLLCWLKNNKIAFEINDETDISNITISHKYDIKMVYKYCLSEYDIKEMSPPKNLIIVNLHNFNGDGCISENARRIAEIMQIKVFTTNEFYKFCHDNLS